MKTLILLFSLLLFGPTASASSDEILFGSLTEHLFIEEGVQKGFENKVGDNGRLILNPMLAMRRTITVEEVYVSYGGFAGENSVGELMGGAMLGHGLTSKHFSLGVVAGGYLQDNQKFRDRDIQPFYIGEINHIGFVPIAGIELSFKAEVDKGVYLTLVNIITPIITSTSVGVGIEL